MGRELVKVPANWDHPKTMRRWGQVDYQPMFHASFSERLGEWQEAKAKWERGEYPDYASEESKLMSFEEWEGEEPNKDDYVPFEPSDCTWYQVWETVSEGTPVTPPFATKEELVEYLVANGDFWDQHRKDGPWSRQSATNFVMGDGWVPSLMVANGQVMTSREIAGFDSPQDVTPSALTK
jgi:hypothetical protein